MISVAFSLEFFTMNGIILSLELAAYADDVAITIRCKFPTHLGTSWKELSTLLCEEDNGLGQT